MYIKKLEIKGFGKISNLVIDLTKGLNIIYGLNESGKSTIQEFIKGMFFGLKGGREGKDGTLPPLKKYKPWNGGHYGGSLEYKLDAGGLYRIERNFDNGTVSVYDSLLNDITGTFPASRDKGAQFAEKHIGINEVCFEKTIFIRQMQSRIGDDGGKELLSRLSNITESGFEDISFKKAEKALKEALITYVGTDRTSARPFDIVMNKLQELKNEKRCLIEKRNFLFAAEKDLDKANADKIRLEVRKKTLSTVRELISLKKEVERLRKQVSGLNEVSDDILQAEKKIQNLSGHANRQSSFNKASTAYGPVIFTVLAAVFAILGVAAEPWGFIAAAVSLIAACIALIINKKHACRASEDEVLMSELLNINNDLKDMYSRAAFIWNSPFRNVDEIVKAAREAEKKYEIMLEKLRTGIISAKNDADCAEVPFIKDELFDKRLSENELKGLELWYDNEYKRINEELSDVVLKIREYETLIKSSLSDDDKIQRIDEEIAELELQKTELEELGFSLKTALELLTAASREISRDYIPRLNDRMSSIINNISSGKYAQLGADEKLVLKAVAPETGELQAASRLSGGTMDQMYLALRIAAAELVAPEGETLPLIMDEALAQYDDIRTANAIKFLDDFSSERQVILFTCKDREVDIAAQVCSGQVNIIKL